MFHDTLTGLPNVLLFIDRLQHALGQAARRKHQVALVYMEIDNFWQITNTNSENDRDAVLRELAARLRSCVLRQEDTVARLCGDQFVMVLGDVDGDRGTKEVLDKIMTTIRQKFRVAGKELAVSASIGASLFPNDGEEWSPLLRHASILMRLTKLAGGNGHAYCGSSIGFSAVT